MGLAHYTHIFPHFPTIPNEPARAIAFQLLLQGPVLACPDVFTGSGPIAEHTLWLSLRDAPRCFAIVGLTASSQQQAISGAIARLTKKEDFPVIIDQLCAAEYWHE
jgi:hypothetical protein